MGNTQELGNLSRPTSGRDAGKFNDSLPKSASLTCRSRVTKVHADAVAPVIFFGSAWALGN
jgi:hypothetical protein